MGDDLRDCTTYDLLLWLLRRRKRFRVTGSSMYPLLKAGDEILVNPYAYQKQRPTPGQIVVAQHPNQADLNRIVLPFQAQGSSLLERQSPEQSQPDKYQQLVYD